MPRMTNLYNNSKVTNGINVPETEGITLDGDAWRAFQQIVSDLATTRYTHTDKAEQFDDYQRIAFYAVMMAQRLGIPFGPAKNEEQDENEDEA